MTAIEIAILLCFLAAIMGILVGLTTMFDGLMKDITDWLGKKIK